VPHHLFQLRGGFVDARALAGHFEGVQITGARIVGKIDLENAKFIRPIEIAGSRIEGALELDHAHTDSLIRLDGSLIDNDVSADGGPVRCNGWRASGSAITPYLGVDS
jgi:hypothetical protein